jgi:hypothetical protein
MFFESLWEVEERKEGRGDLAGSERALSLNLFTREGARERESRENPRDWEEEEEEAEEEEERGG